MKDNAELPGLTIRAMGSFLAGNEDCPEAILTELRLQITSFLKSALVHQEAAEHFKKQAMAIGELAIAVMMVGGMDPGQAKKEVQSWQQFAK